METKAKGLQEILKEDSLLMEKVMPDEAEKILTGNKEDISLEDAYKAYTSILS